MASPRIDCQELQDCVQHLCTKLRELSGRAGVATDQDCDIEATLSTLPPAARPQARAMLSAIQVPTIDAHPTMALAAGYVLALAKEIWRTEPNPMVIKPLRERRRSMRSTWST
jgi:hypothetical protein